MVKNKSFSEIDVLIVGGGVVGTSLALECSSRGMTTVVLDDPAPQKATLAAGAMFGGVSEISPEDLQSMPGKAKIKLLLHAHSTHQDWIESVAGNESHGAAPIRTGTLMIANGRSPDDSASLNLIRSLSEKHNLACGDPASEHLACLNPNPRFQIRDALFLPDERYCDSTEYLDYLKKLLSLNPDGAALVSEKASYFEQLSDGSTVVQTSSGKSFCAKNVVIAAGYRSLDVVEMLGLSELVHSDFYFGKGVGVILRHKSGGSTHVVRTPNRQFACGLHMVPLGNNLCYLGATNRVGGTPGDDNGPTAGEVSNLLLTAIEELNVDLRSAELVSVRHGYRPYFEDSMPKMERLGDSAVYLSTGTYRTGMMTAHVLARETIDLIQGHKRETLDYLDTAKFAFDSETMSIDSVVDKACRDILGFCLEPYGFLPMGRESELATVISSLVRAVGDEQSIEFNYVHAALEEIRKNPSHKEVMTDLFYKLARKNDELF